MIGGGGMVTFEVDGTGEDARRVSEAMRLFTLATSLGGVESLVSIPVLTSHAMISAEQRQKMGVTEQMVRLSVGIESAEDLIADLERALEAVRARQTVSGGVRTVVTLRISFPLRPQFRMQKTGLLRGRFSVSAAGGLEEELHAELHDPGEVRAADLAKAGTAGPNTAAGIAARRHETGHANRLP